jgi:alcohol dehydrogenase
MEFMLEAVAERLADVAAASGADTAGLSTREAAAEAPRQVRRLIAELGLPATLAEAGVPESEHEAIAAASVRDFVVAFAPVAVSEADVLSLLASAR